MNIEQSTASISRRFVAGAAALCIVSVFFVLPLCIAMTLCAMPCCHHDRSVVTADMADCAAACAIKSDAAVPSTVAAVVPDGASVYRVVPDVIAIAPTRDPGFVLERDAGLAHRAADAPLHVLHSTFRI